MLPPERHGIDRWVPGARRAPAQKARTHPHGAVSASHHQRAAHGSRAQTPGGFRQCSRWAELAPRQQNLSYSNSPPMLDSCPVARKLVVSGCVFLQMTIAFVY